MLTFEAPASILSLLPRDRRARCYDKHKTSNRKPTGSCATRKPEYVSGRARAVRRNPAMGRASGPHDVRLDRRSDQGLCGRAGAWRIPPFLSAEPDARPPTVREALKAQGRGSSGRLRRTKFTWLTR